MIGHFTRCADNASNRPMLLVSMMAGIIEFRNLGYAEREIKNAILSTNRHILDILPHPDDLLNSANQAILEYKLTSMS